jgi:hypothetical protein
MNSIKQRRIGKTNAQKQALRLQYKSYAPAKPKLEALQTWYKEKYGEQIAKLSISEILSSKYLHLDAPDVDVNVDRMRERDAKWPVLESCLYDWVLRYEVFGGTISGDLLRYKATQFWEGLPEYSGQETPPWSEGWLEGFKSRHNIKARRGYGESGSADQGEACQKAMADIRAAIAQYEAGDVYNMDETGYRWRTTPDVSLTTETASGRKKDKSRITAVLCSNATGLDRVPIWYIGKAARPSAFRTARIQALDALGARWRYNPTAWMDQKIMIEWLHWFDSRVGRPVLLLMDNFSAHEAAVKAIDDAGGLRFTTVKWLPPNSTSIHQPLDQGIIQNWKAYVRRSFIRFMASSFDSGRNPVKEMNVLRAIRWGIEAWETIVTPATIQNCWGRSQCINWGARPITPDLWSDSTPILQALREDIESLEQQGRIQNAMNIRRFVNPDDEKSQDTGVDSIVEDIIIERTRTDEDIIEDSTPIEAPIITHSEALQALQILQLYEEQQSNSDLDFGRILRAQGHTIECRKSKGLSQTGLDKWISQKN